MIIRVFGAILLSTAMVLGGPTTRPNSVGGAKATTLPTPAELIEQFKKQKAEAAKLPKVAYLSLSRPVVEKSAEFSLFGMEDDALTLRSILDRLYAARNDKDVRAVLITLGDTSLNLAQAEEIRDALLGLRQTGKRTFIYADAYDTASYVLASGATDVCMLSGGEILLPGVGLETLFAKGLLDKIGVQADYIQIGEYKGADEAMTRTQASPELRGELNKLTSALYEQIVAGISANRKLSADAVRQIIDEALMTGETARQRGLVDHLVDMDGLRDLLAKQMGSKIELVRGYGLSERAEVDLSNPFLLLAALARKPEVSSKPAVAVIHAEGVIVDGTGGDGLLGGGGVGSEDIRRAFRIASRDEKIQAVVLRIDSPGGSALASEAMWQAARRFAENKPLVISIGSMAASGGYYLASAGNHVFADPTAIVGSIGVVGGKFVVHGLYEKLGLNSETFSRGRNAALFSSAQPFDEQQRRMVTGWMRQTYEQFTQRVMSTRKGKIKDIDQVARGRIFVASQAKDLGMVDEIGGLQTAIAFAAHQAKLKEGEYDVRSVPAPKTLIDLLQGHDQETMTPLRPKVMLSEDSVLRMLPNSLRGPVMQQLQILQLIQQRPVMLVAPYTVRVNTP